MPDVKIAKLDTGNYFFEESIKVLRGNIQFCGSDIKTILFTSSIPGEGKSEISLHTAASLANSGKKVLLIDADIRRSVLVVRCCLEDEVKGLSQYLSGQCKEEEIICKTNHSNLDMIFSGPTAPNPSELLNSCLFQKLLERQREHYDYILIDSSPVGILIDGAVIGQYCDGAIIVIAEGKVSIRMVKKVKAQMEASGCRILGTVLNRSDLKRGGYYGGYYSKYRNKYDAVPSTGME